MWLRLSYWIMFGIFGTVIAAVPPWWSTVEGIAIGAGFCLVGGVMADPFLESICRATMQREKEGE